jgi:hypothetical protein
MIARKSKGGRRRHKQAGTNNTHSGDTTVAIDPESITTIGQFHADAKITEHATEIRTRSRSTHMSISRWLQERKVNRDESREIGSPCAENVPCDLCPLEEIPATPMALPTSPTWMPIMLETDITNRIHQWVQKTHSHENQLGPREACTRHHRTVSSVHRRTTPGRLAPETIFLKYSGGRHIFTWAAGNMFPNNNILNPPVVTSLFIPYWVKSLSRNS